MTASSNRQFRLAARPVGLPKASDWSLVEEPVPQPGEGQFLVRNEYISLDPAMRGWMNDSKSYVPPVGIGEVMRASAVGEVVASRHPKFPVGSRVAGLFGVQQYALSDGKGARIVDTSLAPLPTYLGVLGMTGMTAYFGLLDVGEAKEGDTVVVSGAAGAVGTVVGQVAKLKGCRVVGIAGGEEKCRFLVDELGFDAAIDYKREDVRAALRQHCPKGIDVYFDNVGGDHLEAALRRINTLGRIPVCGFISGYNSGHSSVSNLSNIIYARVMLRGFVGTDFMHLYGDFQRDMAGWLKEGKVKYQETILDGISNAPNALIGLMEGKNSGKMLVKLAE